MSSGSQIKCAVLGDFNTGNFNRLLGNSREDPPMEVVATPYGQTTSLLLNEEHECWDEADFAVIWTLPHRVSETFSNAFAFQQVDHQKALDEVEEFCRLLRPAASRVDTVIVPTWVLPSHFRGYGPLDLQPGLGIRNLLMRMNVSLAARLADDDDVFVMDSQRWVAGASGEAFPPKLWYMGKTPFSMEVFESAVEDVKAFIRGVTGGARKVIVLDLDNTLWGGVVGDVGLQGLQLGGHDHVGEAYVDFQRGLKNLTRRGVLLALASKNDESLALEAIREHPEMVLSVDDFAGWRINWDDKARNLAELVDDLNLGLEAAVFIDDNPVERARVREAFPEVLVPEWPDDPAFYRSRLDSLRCFDRPALSKEDRKRAQMYTVERKRKSARAEVPDLDEWLDSLETEVRFEKLNEKNLPRAAQLLNKTNQMNLTTRRMSESEFWSWASEQGHRVWTLRVSDRFGDLGLTGLASLEWSGGSGKIVDFILSCRVMGRLIEETLLALVYREAEALDLDVLEAVYRPTDRNGPCREFLENSVLEEATEGDGRFVVEIGKDVGVPSQVDVSGD